MTRPVLLGLTVLGFVVGGMIGNAQTVSAAENKQAPAATRPAVPTMTEAEIKEFLARPLVARLAVVRANGTPQVSPMWFLYEDGVMYMSTLPERAKAKHIKANPRVAVVVDVMEAPLKNKVVTVEGTAEFVTTGVKEMTTRIYKKYVGEEGIKIPAAQQNINAPRVILKIIPKKIESLDTTR